MSSRDMCIPYGEAIPSLLPVMRPFVPRPQHCRTQNPVGNVLHRWWAPAHGREMGSHGSFILSGQSRNESRRPRFAAVVGVRFLVMMGVRLDVRPDTTHQNRSAIHGIRGVQFAAAIMEGADGGRAQYPDSAVDEILTPLVRLGIVEKQRQALPGAVRALRLDLFQLRAPIPHLAHGNGSIEFNRVRRAGQWVQDPPDMRSPDAQVEIEIMLAVADDRLGGGNGIVRRGGANSPDDTTQEANQYKGRKLHRISLDFKQQAAVGRGWQR